MPPNKHSRNCTAALPRVDDEALDNVATPLIITEPPPPAETFTFALLAAGVYSFNLTLSYNPITTTCKPDDLLITLDSIPVSQLPATGNKATINSKQGDIILRCKNLLGQQNQTSRKMQVYLSSSDLLTNSNTILKGAEDNGVGFILESNGSPVTLLNITNSSKGYTNLKEVAAKSKLTDTTVSIPITASYYVYDTNKVKSGALEATALINVKYD